MPSTFWDLKLGENGIYSSQNQMFVLAFYVNSAYNNDIFKTFMLIYAVYGVSCMLLLKRKSTQVKNQSMSYYEAVCTTLYLIIEQFKILI